MTKFDDLKFCDDYMFCKVLTTHPELCRELLELVLEKKVGDFAKIDSQDPVEITPDGKGVRFDIYSEDATSVYDCEMQTTDKHDLPKRSRYYQGMIDLNLIERGAEYNDLQRSYVIFICTFDVFGLGYHKYSFENRCREIPDLVLGDGTKKIFLCAKCDKNDVSKEMQEFLDWLATGTQNTSAFVGKLEQAVEEIRKSEKWRLQYMTLEMKLKEQYKEGQEAGMAEGIEKGKTIAVFDLVNDGIISISDGAKCLGISEAELLADMAK